MRKPAGALCRKCLQRSSRMWCDIYLKWDGSPRAADPVGVTNRSSTQQVWGRGRGRRRAGEEKFMPDSDSVLIFVVVSHAYWKTGVMSSSSSEEQRLLKQCARPALWWTNNRLAVRQLLFIKGTTISSNRFHFHICLISLRAISALLVAAR